MKTFPIAPNRSPEFEKKLDRRSIELRQTMVKVLQVARRGHLASALSMVEILRVLYDDILRYDPHNPKWDLRDRCILSKGHGCLALYVILAEKGFFPEEELWKFCQHGGILGGHPEIRIPGVEASSGSLGHGLSLGVGMALNARIDHRSYRTFVITGDGELNEGSIWEAAMSASKHQLSQLTIIVDYNKQQSYGCTKEVLELEPLSDKWKAFGFGVAEVNGHDVDEMRDCFLNLPLAPLKPSVVICHTIKGKGIPHIEKDLKWHHKSSIADEEIQALYAGLGVIDA